MALNTLGPLNTLSATYTGTLGSNLATDGDNGPCILIRAGLVDPVAEANDYFYINMLTLPSVGTFDWNADSTFSYDAPPGTIDSGTFEWFKNDVKQGEDTVNLSITYSGQIQTTLGAFTQTATDSNGQLSISGGIAQTLSAFTQTLTGQLSGTWLDRTRATTNWTDL
tara:strand:- start:19046 stop:19546 length:501 start_codon:yes stop_codon:yes gene_type:complete